jgi:hypothetical protein
VVGPGVVVDGAAVLEGGLGAVDVGAVAVGVAIGGDVVVGEGEGLRVQDINATDATTTARSRTLVLLCRPMVALPSDHGEPWPRSPVTRQRRRSADDAVDTMTRPFGSMVTPADDAWQGLRRRHDGTLGPTRH